MSAIRANFLVSEYIPEERKLVVEDNNTKNNDLVIGEVMDLPVGNITPEMNIPLTEEQIHHINDNFNRRQTPFARYIKARRREMHQEEK